MRRIAPARLDPVGRLRLPRRPTMLRLALVAALLLTAAGLLYAGPSPPAPATTRSTTPPSPEPTGTAGPVHPDLAARLPIPDGRVGVPVPLSDPTSLAVLSPGDRVDLFAVPAGGGEPVSLAGGASVLAVDRGAAALLLALTPDQGRAVMAAPATTGFAVIVR